MKAMTVSTCSKIFYVALGDQMQKLTKANFGAAWEEAAASHFELEETYSLPSMSTLEEAGKDISHFLGMQPAERSDRVPEGKSSHTLLLAGVFRGGHEVLVQAKLVMAGGLTMQFTVRSTNREVAEVLTFAVG
jgi:coatomer protein complex subunit gamma